MILPSRPEPRAPSGQFLRLRFLVAAALVVGAGISATIVVYIFQALHRGGAPSALHCRILVPAQEDSNHAVLGFSPDGKTLLTSQWRLSKNQAELSTWDLEKKQVAGKVGLPRRLSSISMSARLDFIAVAIGGTLDALAQPTKDDGKPREVRLFNFPDLKETGKIVSDCYIAGVALAPDGSRLATLTEPDGEGRRDAHVNTWDVGTGRRIRTIAEQCRRTGPIRYAPDGKAIAVRLGDFSFEKGADPAIRQFHAETGVPIGEPIPDRSRGFGDFQYSPDGHDLLQISDFGVYGYNLNEKKNRTVYECDPTKGEHISRIAFSVDSHWLVIGIDNGLRFEGSRIKPVIRIWDLQKNELYREWALEGIGTSDIGSLTLSPDKKTLAIGAAGGLFLYDIPAK